MTDQPTIDPTVLDRLDLQHRLDVGIFRHPLLFGQRLRVLFVIDSAIDLSTTGFGLGLVLDTLRSAPWWVRFRVDVARRRWDFASNSPGMPVTVGSPGPYDVKYDYFRFDMPGFSLGDYDQVWFFGFNPGNDGSADDANISQATQTPLDDDELLLLARWMDAGGGVFATGDHHYLGASLCSRVPRVRTMRRWTNADGVPPISGPTRHDTNQPANPAQASGAQFMSFANEGDVVPQSIEVVREPLWSLTPWVRRSAPHPVLCSPYGVIDQFPDHPHEGEVVDDDEVQLDLQPGIAGWAGPEYPGGAGRPTPRVIAYGRSTHAQSNRVKGVLLPKRFGLLGVYDGQPAGVGRVVVDSTWHHWLSLNLVGFKNGNPDVYRLVQSYFRNIGVWLATPAQRSRMLLAASWGVVVGSGPMEFAPSLTWFELGGRALDVLGRTAAPCLMTEWVRDYFVLERVGRWPMPDPCLSCPREDLLERVVLGGIGTGLVRVAVDYQTRAAQGFRALPDPGVLVEAAADGIRAAQADVVQGLRESAERTRELSQVLEDASRKPDLPMLDLGTRRVRLVIEAVQATNPTDPALAEDTVDVAVRVLLDGALVTSRVLPRLRIPEPDRRGLVLRVQEGQLAELEVWDGSTVEVTVAASGDATGRAPTTNERRGTVVLTGPPDDWAGWHRGELGDVWRPWLRVDVEG